MSAEPTAQPASSKVSDGNTSAGCAACRVGKYVKCIGTIRNFQGKKSIGAMIICLVKDPNQIMFHYLQAITAHKAHTSANVRRSPRALSRISSGVCPGSSIRKPAPVADFE
eukprot:COSAG02_NODE_31932_length_525_cov_0.692488_1_plen_110_part_10